MALHFLPTTQWGGNWKYADKSLLTTPYGGDIMFSIRNFVTQTRIYIRFSGDALMYMVNPRDVETGEAAELDHEGWAKADGFDGFYELTDWRDSNESIAAYLQFAIVQSFKLVKKHRNLEFR